MSLNRSVRFLVVAKAEHPSLDVRPVRIVCFAVIVLRRYCERDVVGGSAGRRGDADCPVPGYSGSRDCAVRIDRRGCRRPVYGTGTSVPDTFTAVAPDRLVPVRVTATGTPAVREPDVGEIELSVGPTMNVTLLEVTPGVVVTLTFLFPVAAVAVIAQFAVTVVAVGVPLMVQTTLPAIPDTFTAVVPDRLLPVRVIGTLGPPRTPDVGAIEVSVGLTTVNVTLLVVTPGVVVTLTFLFPVAAVAAIAHVALTVVVVGGVTVLMVQTTLPAVPDTFTAVAPDRLLPVRTTGTLVPRAPG